MEATKLLKQQHGEVKQLFKQFEDEDTPEAQRLIFEQLADNLAAHSEIEEKIFYPAVYVGELKDGLKEAVEEHLAVKRVIADLLEIQPDDENFEAKMTVLQEQVEHHVKEEEGELFPRVQKNFDKSELENLGTEMEQMFQELKQGSPRKEVPSQTKHPAPLE
jgi:hemerythrin superfamily protein